MTKVTPRDDSRTGTPRVLARYRDLDAARQAVQTLGAAGIDGNDLVLVGPAALQAEAGTIDHRATDRDTLRATTRSVTAGIALGGVAAALVGALLMGAVIAFWPGGVQNPWVVFGLMIAWFATGGSLVGAFVAIERTVGLSSSWPLTFGDEPGAPIWLAVYGDVEPTDEDLDTTGPLEVRREPGVMTRHPRQSPLDAQLVDSAAREASG